MRLPETEIRRTLAQHAAIGHGTSAMIVASGEQAVFRADDGFCLYRIIGPYLVVLGDPVVRDWSGRVAFFERLLGFAEASERRPLFFQTSLPWMPLLEARGFSFFKVGEEAQVPLRHVSVEGAGGKRYRQILRLAERAGQRFRVLDTAAVDAVLPDLRAVSTQWLQAKRQREVEFSSGRFDDAYLRRFPCAVVETTAPGGRARIQAFANVLHGPRGEELSVDLMRARPGRPSAMDTLIVSLLLYGRRRGYERFNLGMAPFANVGGAPRAHLGERLGRWLFRTGERWYNYRGLRRYKEKFAPVWQPRFLAYRRQREWPLAIINVAALVSGGWSGLVLPRRSP